MTESLYSPAQQGASVMQRHQESYMRRELRWEATVARLQQQVAQLKGEGSHKAAEDAAEGQAKQLSSIRSVTQLIALVNSVQVY